MPCLYRVFLGFPARLNSMNGVAVAPTSSLVRRFQAEPKAHHRPHYRRLDHEGRANAKIGVGRFNGKMSHATSSDLYQAPTSRRPPQPFAPLSAHKIWPGPGTLLLNSLSYDGPLSARTSPACMSHTLSKIKGRKICTDRFDRLPMVPPGIEILIFTEVNTLQIVRQSICKLRL